MGPLVGFVVADWCWSGLSTFVWLVIWIGGFSNGVGLCGLVVLIMWLHYKKRGL